MEQNTINLFKKIQDEIKNPEIMKIIQYIIELRYLEGYIDCSNDFDIGIKHSYKLLTQKITDLTIMLGNKKGNV